MKQILLFAMLLLLHYHSQAQCNASISASFNSTTSLVTLTNNSTPTAGTNKTTSYWIFWGDNAPNTNVWNNSPQTHLYKMAGSYVVTMIQRVVDSTILPPVICHDTDTAHITVTGAPCAAKANLNQPWNNGNNNTVYLTATSLNSTPNLTYIWDLGNGQTRSGASIAYTYAATGVYQIKLTASIGSCVDDVPVGMISVVGVQPGSVQGQVYNIDSISTNDSVKVWLIEYDSTTKILTAVDSMISPVYHGGAGRAAYYSFTANVPAAYRTKAAVHNGPVSGTGNVPTYHDSSLMWNAATLINHPGGVFTYNKDIYLRKGTLTSGPGFIGGNVNQGANKGTGAGIPGMTVFLLNGTGHVTAFTQTDANGAYSFSNIPVGSYSVAPEDLNYVTTVATLNVTAGSANVTGINFERSNKNKTIVPVVVGISNIEKAQTFSVSPNPAADAVTINWNTLSNKDASIIITDVSGKTVYNTTLTMNTPAVVDISKLQAGFYFLSVNSAAGSDTQKLIIK